ncbi:DUF667 domain-containing protein [archaeon]|nr:MAG: DUF667 domain-containing protein [archaeon]
MCPRRHIMFRNTYQAGFLSILYSIGSKPLQIWDKKGTSSVRLCVVLRRAPSAARCAVNEVRSLCNGIHDWPPARATPPPLPLPPPPPPPGTCTRRGHVP